MQGAYVHKDKVKRDQDRRQKREGKPTFNKFRGIPNY